MKPKVKEPVRLRYKSLANGNTSIYLDIYLNGHRKYEFLRLYLVPEKSKEDRERNKSTMRVANAVKAKRILDIQNEKFSFSKNAGGNTSFFDFFENLSEGYEGSTRNLWNACAGYLHRYEKRENLTFAEADAEWARGFIAYMKGIPSISQNSLISYIGKLKQCFKRAVFEGIIPASPFLKIDNLKAEEREREYLTTEEVKRLVNTPCKKDVVKRAFLFGCITGLRLSDIMKLTWGELKSEKGSYKIVFRQKKTKRQEYMDINAQAVSLMGVKGEDGERVFSELPSENMIGIVLKEWVSDAGIGKHITFHCSRHTFAVMMLDLTSDIYTVSKLLGHRSLETTQVYAKILDKNKLRAVQMIPDLLGED